MSPAIFSGLGTIDADGLKPTTPQNAAGVRNVVATLGTALTKEHARTLQRMAERITLVFDPDAAGERAADRDRKSTRLNSSHSSVSRMPSSA